MKEKKKRTGVYRFKGGVINFVIVFCLKKNSKKLIHHSGSVQKNYENAILYRWHTVYLRAFSCLLQDDDANFQVIL